MFTNPQKLSYTKGQALPKIKEFCGYQERCHQEVKDKLFSFGLHTPDVDELISTLISEDYLNEQRFAIHYAGGKFRMKHWGKVKIKYELRQKRVSDFCIKKALQEIDLDDYEKSIKDQALQKWNTLNREKNIFIKRRKLLNYLLQKGYEAELSREIISALEKES